MNNTDDQVRDGLVLTGFSKTFGTSTVLHDVAARFGRGKIIGVVGENGAGKSTLFKILAGIHEPDSGAELTIDGKPIKLPLTATAAADHGFAFVHQDLGLGATLSVAENIFAGAMITRWGIVNWRAQDRKVRELLAELGVSIDPATRIDELSQAERAVVAIARAIYARGRESASMLVLDEPTANLTGVERDRLFAAMRQAAKKGSSVVFCTHRLDEVVSITDSVLVLRDGRVVHEGPTSALAGEKEIAALILGRAIDEFYVERTSAIRADSDPVLEVTELSGGSVVDLSIQVKPGEILGLTGIAGAGHDEIPELILGSIPAVSGSVIVSQKAVAPSSPVAATRAGIGMLPADRKRRSGIMSATIAENLTLLSFRRFVRFGLIDHRAERRSVIEAMEQFDVRPAGDPDRELITLSGGNQQKVLMAKWSEMKGMKCLILHEPTQGVDVGAKQTILTHIRRLAAEGAGIILISSEHEELSHLADRVLVMRGGRVTSELRAARAKEITEQCYLAV